jgi:predicted phage terminase large subunit-like protein
MPQSGKSNIASVAWAMWDWIANPHRRFLNVSFKMSLAEHFSEDAYKLFKSDWYQNSFALRNNLTLTKETIEYFENSSGGSRRATAFSSATGFGVAGGVLIVDDPHPVSVSTDERIAQVEEFNKGLSNRAGATGSIVVLGQRVHQNDLIGTLDAMGGWDHLCLPNEYDPKRTRVTSVGWKDPRTVEGELLWPEVFNAKRTQAAKGYGLVHYQGQYNQAPIKKGGNIFNRLDFRTYTAEMLPKDFDIHIIVLDCTFNDTKASDFVVCQCWAAVAGNYYLLDQVREQADFTKTLNMFINFCRKWEQAKGKYVESSANGYAVIGTLKNRMAGIIPVKVGNASKVSRYQAVAPIVASHNVYIPKECDWKEVFLLEMESVPNSSHDDQADCLSMALQQLERCLPFTDLYGNANHAVSRMFF